MGPLLMIFYPIRRLRIYACRFLFVFSMINTLEMCTGAMSTYVSYSGEQYSMIDHILLPNEKYDFVTSCEILDDDALNVSNHRPICCHVNLSHAEETTTAAPSVRKSVQWRVAKPEDILNYRESVENQCVSK